MSENYDGNKPIGAFSSLQTYLTYSWINNEYFYSLIPSTYQDFYFRFVKQWFYWYDGWVPYFHNSQSGMVSTRLAYTVIKKLAEKTVGRKILFEDEGLEDNHTIKINKKELNSLEFTEYWANKNKFTSQVRQAYQFAFAGGDSILKLDSDGKDLYLSSLRKDNYLIDTDFRGEICKFQGFIYTYSKLISDNGANTEKKMYYLVEEREYINDKPMFRMVIKTSNASVTNGKSMDNHIDDVPYERLPKEVSRKFKKDYPDVTLGKWSNITLDDLGVYLIKASEKVSFLPDAPCGESILSNLIHLLMTYDFYFSSLTTNLYTTRDRVILPKHMAVPQTGTYDQQLANYNSGLDTYIYTQLPYGGDPASQTPIFIQPDLRDWTQVRNNLLQTVAMSIGVDERTISSAIVPNAEKPTAREISSDEDTTASFVEEKRELNIGELNKLIEQVLRFYGFKDEIITAKFSRAGLTNINNVTTVITLMKQNGAMSTKTMLEKFHTDWNTNQIENEINLIREEMELDANIKEHYQTAVDIKGKEPYFKELEKEVEMTDEVDKNITKNETVDTSHVPKKKNKKGS